jgi:hypothetical protein
LQKPEAVNGGNLQTVACAGRVKQKRTSSTYPLARILSNWQSSG